MVGIFPGLIFRRLRANLPPPGSDNLTPLERCAKLLLQSACKPSKQIERPRTEKYH
jgi:hypothetical protein